MEMSLEQVYEEWSQDHHLWQKEESGVGQRVSLDASSMEWFQAEARGLGLFPSPKQISCRLRAAPDSEVAVLGGGSSGSSSSRATFQLLEE